MSTVLKDIGRYKSNLLSHFLNSDDIMELMLGKEYTEEQVWGDDSKDDDYGIVYDQIFPYLYIDDTQTETKTYLCFEVELPRIPTATIKDAKIIVWAYCHKSLMKYSKKDYSGTRTDILADMVERSIRKYEDEILEQAKSHKVKDVDGIGIGRLHLDSVTYLKPNNNYYGRQMIFSASDFKIKG